MPGLIDVRHHNATGDDIIDTEPITTTIWRLTTIVNNRYESLVEYNKYSTANTYQAVYPNRHQVQVIADDAITINTLHDPPVVMA